MTTVDLSRYHGCFLESVSTHAEAFGEARVRVALSNGPETAVVLELLKVVRVEMDGDDEWASFVDDIEVRQLPRFGPWPPEARHLLAHHDNASAMVWVRLTGPCTIEVLAHELAVHPCRSATPPGSVAG